MKRLAQHWFFFLIVSALCVPAVAQLPPEIRTYDVNQGTPTVDGVVSPGEWDNASAAAGDWRLLREAGAPVDAHNNRFRMMWDSNALHILVETDYTAFLPGGGPGGVDFGADNINLYFDPNVDGEMNGGTQASPQTDPDGYQLAFNNFDGFTECGMDGVALTADDCSIDNRANPTDAINNGSAFGVFTEAHIDTQFGNQGEWAGLRLSQIAQTNGGSGGVAEISIPFSEFDASAGGVNMDGDGLNAGGTPSNGDTWLFNAAVITSDVFNFLPAWNWTESQFFAERPHGEITFVGTSAPDGDFNADGNWDCDDIDALVAEIVAGTNDAAFDMNGDGVVDNADIRDAGTGWLAVGGANNPAQTSGGNSFLVGDANLDGAVDGADFIEWNNNKFQNVAAWCSGDFDANGAVDGADFIEWNNNKFQSADVASVPEPASAFLAVLAGLALSAFRRR